MEYYGRTYLVTTADAEYQVYNAADIAEAVDIYQDMAFNDGGRIISIVEID